jgi:hypothetical protein
MENLKRERRDVKFIFQDNVRMQLKSLDLDPDLLYTEAWIRILIYTEAWIRILI